MGDDVQEIPDGTWPTEPWMRRRRLDNRSLLEFEDKVLEPTGGGAYVWGFRVPAPEVQRLVVFGHLLPEVVELHALLRVFRSYLETKRFF